MPPDPFQVASERVVRDVAGYRLIGKIARGGMGEVFLAQKRGMHGFSKMVVLKVLRSDLAEEHDFLRMFLDEARLSARLAHPNIVQTYEVDTFDHLAFMVMEFVDGETLHRMRVKAKGNVPLAMQLRVFVDVLSALHYAHELQDGAGRLTGVVHRDISPHNVIVSFDGHAKVLDFGIAKALDQSQDETRAGVLKGKLAYMAPEQAGGGNVDGRADVFSVGVMLWEALARKRMWSGENDVGQLRRLVAGDLPKLPDTHAQTGASIDPAMRAIVERALALDPAGRYASAAEFQSALEEALDRLPRAETSSRALALYMQREFGEQRRERQALIDASIQGAAAEDGQALPSLVSAFTGFDGAGHSGPSSLSAPFGHSPSSRVGEAGSRDSASRTLSGESVSASPAPLRPKVVAGKALGVAAALVVVSVGVGAWWVSKKPHAVSDGASNAVSLPGYQASPPVVSYVHVVVDVEPKEAQLFLDGVPVMSPFSKDVPKVDEEHRFSATAADFKPREVRVRFTSDVRLILPLERETSLTAALAAAATGDSSPTPPGGRATTAPGGGPRTPFSGGSGGPRAGKAVDPAQGAASGTPAAAPKPQDGTPKRPERAIDSESPYGSGPP